MKRFLLYASIFSVVISVLIPPVGALADKGIVTDIGAVTVNTEPVRIGPNTVTRATGKTWIDADTGERMYEYTARIESAPQYVGNTPIDCSWHTDITGKWVAGANLFSATVIDRLTKVEYEGDNQIWSPQVFVGGKEYTCDKEPELLPVDPINENYRNNTLSWDYGVCERHLRLIEGMIIETYIFERDPGADVQIKTNGVKDKGFEGEAPVFAYDAAGNDIPISVDKIVKAEDLKGAVYPVVIDPTDTFTTSASDGLIKTRGAYATIQAQTNGDDIYNTWDSLYIGQYFDASGTFILRSYIYFDTSAIPDGSVISAANVSLYGKTDNSTTDFNISVQSGMPTYPHDPLVVGDWEKDYYDVNGIGGVFNTSGFSITGYNNIPLNATGQGWIDKAGTTKFCLRSSRDIGAIAPTYLVLERVLTYSYEKGAGYRPYLEVTYGNPGPPTCTTMDASYVSSTTGRLNGFLNIDGGEACNVSFQYGIAPNENWNFEDSDLEWEYIGFEGLTRNNSASYYDDYSGLLAAPYFYQDLSATEYAGENVSLSMWVNTSAADTAWISISDNVGTSVSANHSGSGDWELLTVSREIDAGATTIRVSGNKSTTGTVTPTGGTITTNGSYTVHKFTSDGTFTTQFDGVISVMVVGGGGGAGTGTTTTTYNGGGGGAGGVVYIDEYEVDADSYTVTSGAGGAGAASVNARGTNGADSVFGDLTAIGGGGGGSSGATYRTGSDGGSGGGAGRYSTTYSAGGATTQTTTNDGYAGTGFGSAGVTSSVNGAGGGGGAGGEGTTKTGGPGKTYTISGASVTYAAGGDAESDASNGDANTGDGGHAAAANSATVGGTGGSGVIIVRYQTDEFISYTGDDVYFDGAMLRIDGIPPTQTDIESKNTGEYWSTNLADLIKNTIYVFRAVAVNTEGTGYGEWLTFITTATVGAPLNLAGYPDTTEVNLIWQKGSGSVNTMIRYNIGAYPIDISDGSLVYAGVSSSYTHTGLTSGTTYYYRAWSDDGHGTYSANYSSCLVTTLAGSASSADTPDAPTMPSNWFGSPDYTNMADAPLYDMWNAVADSIEMPRNSFWMLLTILNVVLISFIFYFLSKGNLLIAVGISAVCMAAAAGMQLISFWYVGIYLITAIAISYRAVTR